MVKLLFVLLLVPLVYVSSKNSNILTVPKKISAGLDAITFVHILKRVGCSNLQSTSIQNGKRLFRVQRNAGRKFDVNLDMPSVQLTTDKYFKFNVTAMNTFGKPVYGDVQLTLGYSGANDSRKIMKQFKIQGKVDINILMQEVQPRIGNCVPIFAEVTETITGNKANSFEIARIYTSSVKLQFSSNQTRIFIPGSVYHYTLQVTKPDDTPLDDPIGEVNITVEYNAQVESVSKQTNMTQERRQSTPKKILLTKQKSVPKDGILYDEIVFPIEAVRGLIIATYINSTAYCYLHAR